MLHVVSRKIGHKAGGFDSHALLCIELSGSLGCRVRRSLMPLPLHLLDEVLPPCHWHPPCNGFVCEIPATALPSPSGAQHEQGTSRADQNVETLHEFACHPFAGAMLIFSVSIPIFHTCCLSKHANLQALLRF